MTPEALNIKDANGCIHFYIKNKAIEEFETHLFTLYHVSSF